MASFLELTLQEGADFQAALSEAGLDTNMARRLIRDGDLAARWVDQLRVELEPVDVELFCPPQSQLMQLERWNWKYDLGFSAEQLEAVGPAPEAPFSRLATPLLSWSLATPEETADKACEIACEVHGAGRLEKGKLLQMRLAEGVSFTPNALSWQIIDLGADQRSSQSPNWFPDAIQEPHRAHAQILQAVAYFPSWARLLGTKSVPAVFLAGYRVTDINGGGRVPLGLEWRGDASGVLSLRPMKYYCQNWALPTCR